MPRTTHSEFKKILISAGLFCAAFGAVGCIQQVSNSFSGDTALASPLGRVSLALSDTGCYICHPAWKDYQSDKDFLSNIGQNFVPGNADDSEFFKRVSGAQGSNVMPPTGVAMSAENLAAIKDWINQMQPAQ